MTEIDFHNSLYQIYLEKRLKAIDKVKYLELKTELIKKYLGSNSNLVVEIEIDKAKKQRNRWQNGTDIEILTLENFARKTCFLQNKKGNKARAERQYYYTLIFGGAFKETSTNRSLSLNN
jgi:hypothetical protein